MHMLRNGRAAVAAKDAGKPHRGAESCRVGRGAGPEQLPSVRPGRGLGRIQCLHAAPSHYVMRL